MTDVPPPGWYADPAGSGGLRWWDGTAWSQLVTTAAAGPGGPAARDADEGTPGYAIAALVLGVTAVGPLAIGFGVAALRQLRRSAVPRGGRGFAIAGIALGTAWSIAITALVVLAAMGALDSVNEDDFTGEARAVAVVIDDLEAAYNDDDEERACRRLWTPRLAGIYADGASSCEDGLDAWLREDLGALDRYDLDARTIDVDGDRAVVVLEGGGPPWVLLREGGRWRLDDEGGGALPDAPDGDLS